MLTFNVRELSAVALLASSRHCTCLLTSGCTLSARCLKAFFMSDREASDLIPKTSYGDCWAADTVTKWPLRHVQQMSPQGLLLKGEVSRLPVSVPGRASAQAAGGALRLDRRPPSRGGTSITVTSI